MYNFYKYFDNSSVEIKITSGHFFTIFFNKLSKEILNITDDNFIGSNIFNYLPEQVANDFKHNIELSLSSENQVSSVIKLNKKYYKVLTVPRYCSSLTRKSIIIFSEDITPQIESETELNFKTILLSKVYEEAPDGFMIFEFETDQDDTGGINTAVGGSLSPFLIDGFQVYEEGSAVNYNATGLITDFSASFTAADLWPYQP